MTVDVSNKVVVITGSSRGIGRSLALSFAKEQAKVVINYLNSDSLATQLYKEIISYNSNCILIKADVTKQEDVKNLYHKTINTFGKVDILINNAGICDDNPIQLMKEEQWRKVLDVNLTGAYLCSRTFSKAMIQKNGGHIINIASLKGQEGCEGQVNYSASKAGLIGFTKALAKELGRFNISVNAICPGFIVTDLNKNMIGEQRFDTSRNILSTNNSLDVCVDFILYLSSDRMTGVSGRVFNLDSRL